MGRAFTVAVAMALTLSILLQYYACPGTAARLLYTRLPSSGTSALAVAPSTPSEGGARWRAAARSGKWLPYPYAGGGVVHYPGYPKYHGYQEGKPMMWAAGASPSLGGYGAGGQLGKGPYADVTRQEQVAMWASLLNPSQRPTTPAWLPASGGEPEEAHELSEPKGLVAVAEGAEMDVPAGGGGVEASQPKWGFRSENNGN